jgi:hypothetical protein
MSGAVERIVVALDTTSENRAAIATAARLAARWKAHLHGVFVEDDDLIRLAHLPFARQVTIGFGAQSLDLPQARRQMRVFAERARQALAAVAARHGVEWSFEIMPPEVSSGGAQWTGDFLVACTTTRPIAGHFRVECRWWGAAESGPSTRLLAHHAGDPDGAVAALIRDHGEPAERLLAAALRLAEANDAPLAVICPPDLAKSAGFKAWLDHQLAGHRRGGHAVETTLELVPDAANLHRLIAGLRCRLVAIEAGADEARPEQLRELLAKIACDVLVVR